MRTLTTGSQVCNMDDVVVILIETETAGIKTNGPRPLGGAAMQMLPGNTPKVHKPRPPSKIAPPGVRSRMAHMKRSDRPPQQHDFPEQVHYNGLTNGYSSSDHDEQDHPRNENSSPLIKHARNTRIGHLGSREGARNGRRADSHQGSRDTSGRSSNELEIPIAQANQQRAPLQRYRGHIKLRRDILGGKTLHTITFQA